jgi:hypothetical protein
MHLLRKQPDFFNENPYAAPQSLSDPPSPGSMLRASLTVGTDEIHQVEILGSISSGLEIYLVDGQERLRTHAWCGARRFDVGDKEVHHVEVRVSLLWSVRVLVDGRVIIDDAFPRMHRFNRFVAAPLCLLLFPALLAVGGLLVGEVLLILQMLFSRGG